MLSPRWLGLALIDLLPEQRLVRPTLPVKNPCFQQRLKSDVDVELMRSEAEELGGNAIQAVVAHHLEDDVDEHSSDVKGSHQSQASPEFFSCCWRLIVRPGTGSVGHRLIVTSITLAKERAGVQQSSLTFTSARFDGMGKCQGKLGIAALALLHQSVVGIESSAQRRLPCLRSSRGIPVAASAEPV